MLHRVPQLPLPLADARYASLTGTTILAPFPLVRAATVDAFSQASCSHPLSAPCDAPSTAPAPRSAVYKAPYEAPCGVTV